MAKAREINIRRMERADLEDVLAIERTSFGDPWPVMAFLGEFENQVSFQYVAVSGTNRIAGYCIYWIVLDEGHILNIAVAQDERGQGIGRKLMNFCLDHMFSMGVHYVLLEVRLNNAVAQGLYKSLGFRELNIRYGYYADGSDAVIMLKEMR